MSVWRRIVMETSLKPFRVLTMESIRMVAADLFRQWAPLIRYAEQSAVLLWVADGSEILTYPGKLDQEFEWCRYTGFSNTQYAHAYEGPGARESSKAQLYIPDPPHMTYRWLKDIIAALKEVGREVTSKPVSVGATFDPGPEFAHSPFKYELHPELYARGLRGREVELQSVPMLCCYATLNADTALYAGFPQGIPQGLSFGRFMGRQTQHFLSDLGFDYIWFSNGFGFSHFGWSGLGEAFDGRRFEPERARELAEGTLLFWQDFRAECPEFPIETRGTNFSTGMDLASDGVPWERVYQGGFNVTPPPNSPWGVLDGDFGLEMVGFMTRIASLPGDTFPFRYYTHDPWFQRSPWWDSYDREPYDIYCPLSVGRIDATGKVMRPADVEFLSVDQAEGSYPERCALEVIPHVMIAADHLPDAPGILTWVYPFHEYHSMTYAEPSRIDEVYFGDWFVRSAINDGLPLNTIVSNENFVQSYDRCPSLYHETILFLPVPGEGSPVASRVADLVTHSGCALLYGPTTYASERMRELLGLALDEPISGELDLDSQVNLDRLETGSYPGRIHHRALTSAGGIAEVLRYPEGGHTCACAVVSGAGGQRVVAVLRSQPEWDGGSIGWLRGTNSFSTESRPRLPILDDPMTWFHGGLVPRFMLARMGYRIEVEKQSPAMRTPLCFVHRANNGFWFSGHVPQTVVRSRFRFPYGAPLLIGWETRLEKGLSTYCFGHTYHEECRAFVEQQGGGVLSCVEYPSRNPEIRRRIRISGLDNATVRFFREADASASQPVDRPVFVTRDAGEMLRDRRAELPYDLEADGRQLVMRGISGSVILSW